MNDRSWVSVWSASPQPIWDQDFVFPTKIPATARDQTIRQIVRLSLGGSRLRVVFSNEYGTVPLRIGAASVARTDNGAAIAHDTLRTLTFGGQAGAILPAGAPLISDPVDIEVGEATRLAISLYLPDETPLTTFHWDGKQTAYIGSGDRTAQDAFPSTYTTDARILLSGVRADTPNNGAVAVFGDSITDGAGAPLDADTRWTDYLARRLAPQRVSVLNAGISGARLLQDKMGVNAAARFTRDVLAQPGVKAVILLLGINDIGWPGTTFIPANKEIRRWRKASIWTPYSEAASANHKSSERKIRWTIDPLENPASRFPFSVLEPEPSAAKALSSAPGATRTSPKRAV